MLSFNFIFRLEDWRKKSSNDFQLGKRGVKEEHELLNDADEEKLADNGISEEEAENRINLRHHQAL